MRRYPGYATSEPLNILPLGVSQFLFRSLITYFFFFVQCFSACFAFGHTVLIPVPSASPYSPYSPEASKMTKVATIDAASTKRHHNISVKRSKRHFCWCWRANEESPCFLPFVEGFRRRFNASDAHPCFSAFQTSISAVNAWRHFRRCPITWGSFSQSLSHGKSRIVSLGAKTPWICFRSWPQLVLQFRTIPQLTVSFSVYVLPTPVIRSKTWTIRCQCRPDGCCHLLNCVENIISGGCHSDASNSRFLRQWYQLFYFTPWVRPRVPLSTPRI